MVLMFANGKYKQRCKQIIMINEVAKELGLGINEKHDNAVLYSVMRIFLERKAEEQKICSKSLILKIEEDNCISIFKHYDDYVEKFEEIEI